VDNRLCSLGGGTSHGELKLSGRHATVHQDADLRLLDHLTGCYDLIIDDLNLLDAYLLLEHLTVASRLVRLLLDEHGASSGELLLGCGVLHLHPCLPEVSSGEASDAGELHWYLWLLLDGSWALPEAAEYVVEGLLKICLSSWLRLWHAGVHDVEKVVGSGWSVAASHPRVQEIVRGCGGILSFGRARIKVKKIDFTSRLLANLLRLGLCLIVTVIAVSTSRYSRE